MYRKHGPEAERAVGEMEFAAGAAAMSDSGGYGDCSVCAGIIGSGDLRLGDDLGRVLELYRNATGGRLRGVRQIAAWHRDPAARGSMANPPPGLLLEPVAGRGLAAIERAGLSFDVFAYHTQLGELVEVARRHPDLPMIVNHIGGAIGIGPYAGRRDEVFSDWRAGMVELGRCANVRVKLSGLGMRVFGFGFGDRPQPPSSSDLAAAWAPYIEACIEIFGADRCMFGSNFPVDKGTCSYRVLWNAFKRIVAGASEREKQALFAGTASERLSPGRRRHGERRSAAGEPHGPPPHRPDRTRSAGAGIWRRHAGRCPRCHQRASGAGRDRGRLHSRHRLFRHLPLVRQRQERAALRRRAARQAARLVHPEHQGRPRLREMHRSQSSEPGALAGRPAVQSDIRLHARRRAAVLRAEPAPAGADLGRCAADP